MYKQIGIFFSILLSFNLNIFSSESLSNPSGKEIKEFSEIKIKNENDNQDKDEIVDQLGKLHKTQRLFAVNPTLIKEKINEKLRGKSTKKLKNYISDKKKALERKKEKDLEQVKNNTTELTDITDLSGAPKSTITKLEIMEDYNNKIRNLDHPMLKNLINEELERRKNLRPGFAESERIKAMDEADREKNSSCCIIS